MELSELGWNEFFEKHFEELKTEGTVPARVATVQKDMYMVCSAAGELKAEISGKLRYNTVSMSELPVVGDWVVARVRSEGDPAIIEGVLPRSSKISRKVVGERTEEQVLVANIDTVFLISGLDGDYNLRRIERYLVAVRDIAASSVVILNKADVCSNARDKIAEVEAVSAGVPVIALSALNEEGLEQLKQFTKKGTTIAFLGSSGAGKSTIINCLLGREKQKVGAVRERDCRGRHITTHRELILLPDGGIVIDNPGLRELQLWLDEDKLYEIFDDIMVFAEKCRFRDCKHENEPDCAVRAAIEKDELDARRFESYMKLRKEQKYLETRKLEKSKNEKIVFEKKISKWSKHIKRHKKKYEF